MPTPTPVIRPVAQRPPFNRERQTESSLERQETGRRERSDSRQTLHAPFRLSHQLRNPRRRLESFARQRHPHRKHVVPIEARVDSAQYHERSQQQGRPYQQDQRQSHFDHHQNRSRFVLTQTTPDRCPLSLRVKFRSAREAFNAGTSPNTIPVSSDTPSVNTNTRQSSTTPDPSSPIRGMFPGLITSSARTPTYPSPRPSTPPARDNITLSVSNCRINAPRPAPIAARMAISRLRIVARASSRFATLAQAINSTKLTAPTNTSSDFRTSPTTVSRSGSAVNVSVGRIPSGNFRLYSSAA